MRRASPNATRPKPISVSKEIKKKNYIFEENINNNHTKL